MFSYQWVDKALQGLISTKLFAADLFKGEYNHQGEIGTQMS